jgi:2-dehydro-3-deoxyglucarate aldolase/4-hydroxy-2-oxoheptanedioate aldolase
MADQLIPVNRLRATLGAGGRGVGTMVAEFRQPAVMQLLANAGFDFVIIDGEHGPFGPETVADLARAAVAHGVTPIVRVPACDYVPIAQALDAGAQGVMVPRIMGVEDAADAAAIATYPPVGRRGSAMGRGHTVFRGGEVSSLMAAMNAERLVVIQIETLPSLEACEQIAALDGVDVLFVGPNDLSIALGVPGQLTHPLVEGAIERVAAACRAAGKWSAVQMNTVDGAARWAPHVDLVSHSAEIGMLQAAGTAAVTAIRAAG